MTAYYIALISPFKGAISMSVGITLVEISTPFMHYRQYLFIHGKGDGILQVINSVFFFSTFLVGRILFFTYFSYKTANTFYIDTFQSVTNNY